MTVKLKVVGVLTFLFLGGCYSWYPHYVTPNVPQDELAVNPNTEIQKLRNLFSSHKWSFPDQSNIQVRDYGFSELVVFSNTSIIVFPKNWKNNYFQLIFLNGIPDSNAGLSKVAELVLLEKYAPFLDQKQISSNRESKPIALGIEFGMTNAQVKAALDLYRSHFIFPPEIQITIDDPDVIYGNMHAFADGTDLLFIIYFSNNSCCAYSLRTVSCPMVEWYDGRTGYYDHLRTQK